MAYALDRTSVFSKSIHVLGAYGIRLRPNIGLLKRETLCKQKHCGMFCAKCQSFGVEVERLAGAEVGRVVGAKQDNNTA